tara:strand:+ start:1370 stop:2131 length:762 start_codon:yes stop_codon:yes gene_type:complete
MGNSINKHKVLSREVGSRIFPVLSSGFSNTYSLTLDGVDQYVNCGDIGGLDGASTASWSAWVYIDDSGENYVMSQWSASDSNDRQFMFFIKPSANRVDIYCGSNISYRRTDITIATGQWHHMAVTFNGGNTAKDRAIFYLNGTQYKQTTYNGPTSLKASPGSDFNIGRRTDYTFYEFEGEIDEVSIFTSELSQSEITALYNSGTPTDLTSHAGIIHWWRMGDDDGGTGSTITDQIGSNNGTLVNSPAFSTSVP